MENQENQMEEPEIINPEQFQVGRAPIDEKVEGQEDAEFAEEEGSFADEEVSLLEEDVEVPDQEDVEEDLDAEVDEEDQA
ncbi:hypothetical protein ACXZ1K_16235 [Pedobacter sp. PWIIR3]